MTQTDEKSIHFCILLPNQNSANCAAANGERPWLAAALYACEARRKKTFSHSPRMHPLIALLSSPLASIRKGRGRENKRCRRAVEASFLFASIGMQSTREDASFARSISSSPLDPPLIPPPFD
ncbi:hypothetical protein CDAR_480851 [Caerostris darwini]|uniref:Uncharacterized protein n=1 Tax=Caerostris darwini TaxID=1538125 RepID=A0AAV4S2Q0_9ARAC|nr:hypothetical protein CDAR_480851 [Caerostris darwini]